MIYASILFLNIFTIAFVESDFGYHGHGHQDGEYGLRVCPPWARNNYCDMKRDIIWRLKVAGHLWGNRCRDNLQGIDAKICGAVLKGSFDTCHGGNTTLLAPNCARDCRILHRDLGGDCTQGNTPRDRCICYYDKIKP